MFAKLQKGEKVLDIGSGLGVDSFIAAHYVGTEGKVIGIDISKKEVIHAAQRAEQRKANCMFVWADMEKLPLPDNELDVVISNGAFCLAPNKEKALKEIYRVLRPGGRVAIWMSTIFTELEGGVNWPICMRMFAEKTTVIPLVEKVGFVNAVLDDSNSEM